MARKFPRFAVLLAVLVLLLLVADLYLVHTVAPRLFLSNILFSFIVALATLCSLRVVLRSSGYARQIWLLVTVALLIETVAQILSTYYQSFVAGSLFNPAPPDILFFVWAAPIFLIFLPRLSNESSAIDSIRVLDFLQLSIVAVTIYLYFFYAPSRWLNDQYGLLRGILLLYLARDLFLAFGFLLRSRSLAFSSYRSFSLFFAFFFFIAALTDLGYIVTIKTSAGDATWIDVLWSVSYLALVIFSVRWMQPESDSVPLPATRVSNFFAQQLLPIFLPLFVILMAYAIAREQFLLGWLTVAAAVVCSSVRLILTNLKQRVVSDNLLSTEKALRRTEEMLSTAFRSSPDAFSINIFPNGPYLEINEGFTRLTGYSREETIGKIPAQLKLWIDPNDLAQVRAEVSRTGDVRDVEFRFRTKSGEIRVGLMSASLIELDSRTCALVVVRDITARKEAENILRTSEERFRSLVQHLHVGIVTYDPEGRVVFTNQTALDLFGFTPEQVFGRTVPELGLTAIREDGTVLPDSQRPLPSAIATGKPIRSQFIGWLRPHRPGVIWTLLDVVPEFSATGQLFRVVVSFTDLTEQRRAAEALRESEELFRTLVHDLHIAVVLHRPDHRIEFANAAAYRMFDVSEGTAVGKFPSDYGIVVLNESGEEVPPVEHPVATVLRTKAPVPNGLLAIRHSGTDKLLWAFGNAVPQFDASGHVIRVITSFADVSEMKNAESAIRQLSNQLLRLQDEERRRIGRELHDGLAQTVLAINLSLAQVRETLPPHEKAVRALEKARSFTQQMSREIRTLSYLLHPPLLDDLGLVSALREYAQGFTDRSFIDTRLYLLSPFNRLPQPVELALFRVVQESLANIQRHSGSTTAKIRLRQEGLVVTLEIVDFGHGMILPHHVTSGNQARLGVGIPGMRERISQLGGRLDIYSSRAGTTVRATVSLAELPDRKNLADVSSPAM